MDILESLNKSFLVSKREIIVLDYDKNKVRKIENIYKIESNTFLGTILYKTGGITFDNWVRVLGAGERDIIYCNELLKISDMFIVAEDILGGLFAISNDNYIWYFAPDSLEWENLEILYSQFIQWLIDGDVEKFYEIFRWDNWRNDIKSIALSDGIAFYPFLWAKCDSISERSRKIIPLDEIVKLQFEFRKQLDTST